MSRITVTFSNVFSSEPAVQVPIQAGTSLADFLATQGDVPEGATIRLNRQPVASNAGELVHGDIVSINPSQVKGA